MIGIMYPLIPDHIHDSSLNEGFFSFVLLLLPSANKIKLFYTLFHFCRCNSTHKLLKYFQLQISHVILISGITTNCRRLILLMCLNSLINLLITFTKIWPVLNNRLPISLMFLTQIVIQMKIIQLCSSRTSIASTFVLNIIPSFSSFAGWIPFL